MTRTLLFLLSVIMVTSSVTVSTTQASDRVTTTERSGFNLSREVPAGYYRKHRYKVHKKIFKHHRKHSRKFHRRHWH